MWYMSIAIMVWWKSGFVSENFECFQWNSRVVIISCHNDNLLYRDQQGRQSRL